MGRIGKAGLVEGHGLAGKVGVGDDRIADLEQRHPARQTSVAQLGDQRVDDVRGRVAAAGGIVGAHGLVAQATSGLGEDYREHLARDRRPDRDRRLRNRRADRRDTLAGGLRQREGRR